MSCVNTNSKEFKDTVSRLDVHPDNLEVVLHKFLNTEGDSFPTDPQIMAELSGKPFNATMDDFKWYTKNFLYKPITFGSLEAAYSKFRLIRDILGYNNSAVTMYRNSKGEYVVSVGTPKSASIPFAIDNTLVDTLLDSVRETNPYHQIFKSIVDSIGKSNISIRQGLVSEDSDIASNRSPAAFFPSSNEIIFFPEHMGHLNGMTERGRKSWIFQILTHELVHQFAFETLDKDPSSLVTRAEKVFHDEITSLFQEAQKSIGENEFYGMKNVQEFIAEALTNRDFQKRLAGIKSNKKSLWQRLVDAFSKVFSAQGIDINNTLLADILSATEEFIAKSPEIKAEKNALAEQQRAEAELLDEIFISEMEGTPDIDKVLGFDSPTLNKVVSRYSNRISNYTYYMFTVGEGTSKRYAVNIPTNSRETIVEAREKVQNFLRENGLDPARYGISREFKNVGGRTALYVSPKRKKKADATPTVKETAVNNAPRFTDRESSFLDYLYDVRPDLASKVVDGLIDIDELMMHEDELGVFAEAPREEVQWARTATNSYEVSTQGDSRFSALRAKFKPGTIIDGVDVRGRTIEDVYQSVIKKSRKGQAPSKDSKLYRTSVSSYTGNITPDANTIFVFGSNPEGRHGAGAARVAREQFGAVYGVGEGLTGNSYALPTKDLRAQKLYSEDGGKTPVTLYRGYALTENREAASIEETINRKSVDYDPSLKGALYFTSSREEATEYAEGRADKSMPGYTGDYAKVSQYHIKAGAIVEHYADMNDYRKRGASSTADVIVLDRGTLNSTASEYIVKNPSVIVYPNNLRSVPKEAIVESVKKLYDTARTMPNKKFKVAYRNTDKVSLNGYTGLEMIDMFLEAGPIPTNIIFSKEWVDTGKFNLSKEALEDFSYREGYLPLWKEWAKQNPELIQELREKSAGKVLTDKFASTRVSQARALAEILNSEELTSDLTPETENRLLVFSGEFEGGYNSLVGIVPEPLLSKVEDYIMSGGQIGLSEADAQQFLNYAETAYAEQETTNQEQQTIKKENKAYMERAVTITQQIDNLNNSTALSATEVRHVAEQAVYWISDHITEIQETPGLAEKIYGEKFKDKDFASMSRAEVVRTIGPDDMIAMCKEKFSPENTDYEDFDTIEKAEIITDNWGAIMMLASNAFLDMEKFSIVSSKDGKTSEVSEDYVADADNFNYSNMEGDVFENKGNLQEHWQVETKTLDVLATMSQIVRQALTKCYLLDKDGNNIKSEFGINERVTAREATNSILRWAQGALNLEQMIGKLQEKADSNPWLRQIISRLSDTSGKEADFQSQFFGVFCKHFQLYSVVIKENGRYKSIQVNKNPALSEAMTQVTTQYKIGEHPLFTTEGINKDAFNELKSAFEELDKYNHQGYDLTNTETRDEAARTLGYISNLLGYYVTPEMVAENLNKDTFKRMYSALRYITNSLEKNLDNATYEPFKFGSRDGINGNTREFLKPITDHLEDIAVSAFYDSGKMYQSYITPSYTSKLFQKFRQTGKAFDDFIMAEYGDISWFHTGTNIERGWRNAWLKSLATDSKAREIFKHKVQLNFNKHNYMKNMSDMEYTLSLLTEFFSENASEKQTRVPAWFRVPMLSNKPSSEFIRFYSERGANYREELTNGFKMIFDQELSRIQTVEMRNLSESDPRFIKNFDSNGKKFMFLDFMNEYLTGDKKSSELGKLIRQKLDGHQVDEARLNKLAKEAIMQTMETRAESIVTAWEAQGILKGAEKVANIGTTEEEIRENLKNFVWNDTFAAINIMQLTVTDIAFYKDAEDLQKRLAQIHAPGVRGNASATDYGTYDESGKMIEKPKPVTDGKFRTIKLADFDTFISNIIDNVSVVFDRRIANAAESEKAALRALKDSLVGKDGAFRKINVTDAQGYSSPTSYRKKALVFGKWSRQAEEIYHKLKKGTYTYKDLKIAFQPLKPFVYSQIIKDAGVEGAPLGKIKVPVQYKNSEYLLIMADAILQGENTGRPNLLRAIFEVMEESHFDEKGNYKTDGIDTVQFESTVKSGLMGKINLNDLVKDPNGESIAKARMEAAIYEATPKEVTEVNPKTGVEETKTIYERTGQYNSVTVDAVPFEDYCLQQEVPEHFKEHEQAHGSQLRYIIVSELENFNYLGEPVTYNLEGRQVTAQEFKAEYESTIAENIQESIDELSEELSLNDLGSIKDRNIALSKILQREILSSPRYGVDLLQACSVDENGRFRIPLGDPIQSKRVEQLINSIIKNRINKQKIPGGPVVQVTNFGTSRELNIRFKDKSGNLLQTRAEFEGTDAEYRNYIKENQAGIAYFEVFAPIYSNKLFTQFADKNGVINTQALEMLDPDLLKMIGYRIPTEDKYSMAPLKIVGFLPVEAGDGIMLPNDITLLTGSDFDVDKVYLMRKDYGITRNKEVKRSAMHRILYDELVSSQKGKLSYDTKVQLGELIEQFLDDPFDSSSLVNQKTAKGFMTMPRDAYNMMLRTYMQNMYTVNRPTEGRTYRNNKIVDMTYEVLTHETSADKILNPGGFDQQKRMGYLVNAYKMHSDQYTWEQLQGMSISQLKDLNNSSKNLSYIDTHIQFYKQNSAAGALIGIFAVNRIAHAVLESGSADGSSTYLMNVNNVCKITGSFTVAGMEFGGYMPFDMRYDRNGQLIGKVMGSLVASAADAVKDPVLNLMNINSNTANILNTLVRLGMPFDNAALFLSQSVISDVLADFSRENITGYMSLSKVIQNKLNDIKKETDIDEYSDINKEELTYEELVEGLKPNAKPEIAYKTLVAFGNFQKIAEAMRMPTFATRSNSMSSAVGPLIIDNLITEYKMQKLSLESNIVDTNLNPVDMNDIFLSHPILNQLQRTVGIARQLFGNMPANSTGFRNILDLVNESPLSSVIFGDRKLLSSLSDFYQSYLVMKNGVVNPQELGSTITEFPKKFMEREYKKKYADNALIQAIKYGTDKSGRATLQVDITGLDTQQKEKLSSAWIDLHKVDPELSIKLFNYNFFRGGIGFSPKTFMNLVPVYVKEKIPGYVDTFRVLPYTVPEIVLDQFIRNNWDNNRLVPRKSVTFKELPNGHVEVFKTSEVRDLSDVQYFKTAVNGVDKLFMQILKKDESIEFKEITPLGSNKEYLEMSESNIDSPLNVPTEAKVETTEAEVGKESELADTEVSAEAEETERVTTDETRLNDLLYQILVIEGVMNEEQAGEYIRNYKAKSEAEKVAMERQIKKSFEARFKKLGIEFNEKLIDDIYKLIC